jgi:hypothetical protein
MESGKSKYAQVMATQCSEPSLEQEPLSKINYSLHYIHNPAFAQAFKLHQSHQIKEQFRIMNWV